MNDSRKQGWVRLHRQIQDNFLWFLEPFTKAQAWVDLFLNANHKDGLINIRGNIIPIKRGQIGWSELTMAKRWTWSRAKVRRFLKLLETEQQIEQQKSSLTSIITVLKYEEYQQNDTADDTTERQQKDSRRYTNKNDKKEKKDKNKDRGIALQKITPKKLTLKTQLAHEIILFMKNELGFPFLDGTQAENVFYAKKLLFKFGTVEKVKLLISAVGRDTFWSTKITTLKRLDERSMEIIKNSTNQKRSGTYVSE